MSRSRLQTVVAGRETERGPYNHLGSIPRPECFDGMDTTPSTSTADCYLKCLNAFDFDDDEDVDLHDFAVLQRAFGE